MRLATPSSSGSMRAADKHSRTSAGGVDLGQLEVVLGIDQATQLQAGEQLIQFDARAAVALALCKCLQLLFDGAAIVQSPACLPSTRICSARSLHAQVDEPAAREHHHRQHHHGGQPLRAAPEECQFHCTDLI